MANVSEAMQANSNQLNAADIMGVEPIITVQSVNLTNEAGKKTVWVHYHGGEGRPWRVSTGMVRILSAGWGPESDNWIGKSVKIFNEPTVRFGGKEVGGVQIRAMSDIPERGIKATLSINRTKRVPFPVAHLAMQAPSYPEDRFNATFDKMVGAMESGKMTLEGIIHQCQQTGTLTQEQLKRLSDARPLDAESEDH